MLQVDAPPRQRSWVRVPAIAAPVALIGCWTAGAALQPAWYSSLSSPISELAATTAKARWVMSLGFVVTGACLLALAAGLPVRRAGRIALGVAGAGILVVAAQPLPGNAGPHTAGAWAAFVALAVWPWLASGSWVARVATAVNVVLLVAVYAQPPGGAYYGLLERLLAGTELVLTAAVVCAGRRR